MHTKRKLAIAGVAATLLMALAVTTASANRLSISNRNFRLVHTELKFLDEAGSALVTCPVTLEGSFHSTQSQKVEGSLSGFISRAAIGNESCRGGHATISQETLPWHVIYNGFRGILPRITAIRSSVRGVAFLVEVFFVRCRYWNQTTEEESSGEALVEAGGAITGIAIDRTIRIRKFSGPELCPRTIGFEGTGTVTLLGTITAITVRLI